MEGAGAMIEGAGAMIEGAAAMIEGSGAMIEGAGAMIEGAGARNFRKWTFIYRTDPGIRQNPPCMDSESTVNGFRIHRKWIQNPP